MILLLLFITAFIFLAYYFLLIKLKLDCPHQKIILAGLLSCNQIILTQLLVGVVGLLYLPVVIFLNIGVSTVITIYSRVFQKEIRPVLQEEYQNIVIGIKNSLSLGSIFLLVLIGLTLIWISIAIYLLPPRYFDDLTYHLPPIYEYIFNHKISLLSVKFNNRFAFPENAELLFLWPAIFLHSQQFVSCVQFITALWGVVAVYGLARLQGISSKISCFVSLLFLLTPVVLAQMGICFIDVTISVLTLIVLYCVLMFHRNNRLLYFYFTALALGLLWGMKYNEFLFLFMVAPFLYVKRKIQPRHWFGFIAVLLIAGGFWYLRNFLIFKTPVYPPFFPVKYPYVYSDHLENYSLGVFLTSIPSKLLLLWKDTCLESLQYGPIFWGLALPAWFYVWARSIVQRNMLVGWMYSWFIVGVGQLMLLPLQDYHQHNVARYSIFVVALGLLALGQVMMTFDRIVFFRKTIKVLCILFAIFVVVHLGKNEPSYRIDEPIKDIAAGKYISEQSYCGYGADCQVWAAIDYFTADDSKGLSIYVGSMFKEDVANALDYGMKLQNRIWNIQKGKKHQPDAFLFINVVKDQRSSRGYCHAAVTQEDVKLDPEYLLIVQVHDYFLSQDFYLFMRRDYFKDPKKLKLLMNYYRITGRAMPLTVIK